MLRAEFSEAYDDDNSTIYKLEASTLRRRISKLQRPIYYLFGYGVPVIVVAVCLVISSVTENNLFIKEGYFDDGGQQLKCWYDGNFVAPFSYVGLAVGAINFIDRKSFV